MPLRVLCVAAALVALAPPPARADEPGRKPDPVSDLLAKLRKPADMAHDGGMKLATLADLLEDKAGVAVVVNEEAFKAEGIDLGQEVKLARRKALPLGVVLRHALGEWQATYLVRKGHIEILPRAAAAREVTPDLADEPNYVLKEPLVSTIYKEKPLNEALADLAEEYNLNIVIAPQAGDNKTGFVSVRLLNVPADAAIEMLALQADLRVTRRGNAYFVTGKDHANELLSERLEKQMKEIEVERARAAPFNPTPPALQPQPQPAPAPAPAAPPPPPKM